MIRHEVTADGSRCSAAPDDLVEGVCARDLSRIRGALAPDAVLRALLPGGLREWSGAGAIADRFLVWFGDAELEVLDTAAGTIGGHIQVRWRVRVRTPRFGPGWLVVEQVAYGDTDDEGRITNLHLLCTGFLPEPSNG